MRWFDVALGAFSSPDSWTPSPYDPPSLNRYGYVLNNPLRYTDPTGHRACDDFDAGGRCVTAPPAQVGTTRYTSSTIGRTITVTIPSTPQPPVPSSEPDPVEIDEPFFPCASGDLGDCERDMVYGEGGLSSSQAAANILQTLHNRAFTAFTCAPNCINDDWNRINPSGVPWEDITQDQFLRLVLFLSGEEYYNSSGMPIAQYVAWRTRLDYQFINSNSIAYGIWTGIGAGADTWLATGAGVTSQNAPIVVGGIVPAVPLRDPAVMFYYSFDEMVNPPDSVWLDIVPIGEHDARYQYYFTYPYHP